MSPELIFMGLYSAFCEAVPGMRHLCQTVYVKWGQQSGEIISHLSGWMDGWMDLMFNNDAFTLLQSMSSVSPAQQTI